MWKQLVLAELHAGAQISDKEVASNYNLKAVCRFVVLLLSTFCGFPFLPRVLPLPFRNFAHYCAALLNAPMSDRDKKECFPWVTFPGKSLSFVIDARINGIYAYRLTGVIMIPHWIGCCEKVRKFLIHESSVTTKCRVCSQCNEITKEERGTKIIQHLNSTYNSALSLLHHTPDGNIFIKKMTMKHTVKNLLQCF